MAKSTVVQYLLKVKTDKAEKNLKDTGKAADRTGDAFKRTKTSGLQMASQLGSAMTGMTVGVAAAAAGIRMLKDAFMFAARESFEFSKQVVDSINQLNDLSARSGLAADSIQAVIVAFEGSGQSAAAAEGFISRFPRLFADLAIGSSRASQAAEQLGVSIKDANGDMRSADQILLDTARALQGLTDDTERATAGFLLFGRGAGQFLQAFGKTAAFEDFMALAEEFGVRTGPEASQQAAVWQEQMAALNLVTAGLKQRLDEALGGTLRFNGALRNLLGFLAGTQALIETNTETFHKFGTSIEDMAVRMLPMFQFILGEMAKFVGFHITYMATAVNAMIDVMVLFRKLVDRSAGAMSGLDSVLPSTKDLQAVSVEMNGIVQSALMMSESLSDLGGLIQTGGEAGVFATARASFLERLDSILAGLSSGMESAGFNLDELGDESAAAADEMKKLTVKTSQAMRNLGLLTTGDVPGMLRGATGLAGEAAGRLSPLLAASSVPAIAASGASAMAASVAGALANPAVGAAIAGVAILAKLGQKTPDERRKDLLAQVESIKTGLTYLPEILLQVIPQVAAALAEAILDGLVLMLVKFKDMIVEGFKSVLPSFNGRDRHPGAQGSEMMGNLRSAGQYWRDFLDPNKTATFAGGGRFLGAEGGIRFTGSGSGLAMLHPGEFVVPQSGQAPQSVSRRLGGMGGSPINISIHSPIVEQNAVDALVRRIEERFNSNFGLASSSLFGGR